MVEIVRPELDRNAAQRVKGMAEKQELALRIELRPLDAFPVPGSANFQPAVTGPPKVAAGPGFRGTYHRGSHFGPDPLTSIRATAAANM